MAGEDIAFELGGKIGEGILVIGVLVLGYMTWKWLKGKKESKTDNSKENKS